MCALTASVVSVCAAPLRVGWALSAQIGTALTRGVVKRMGRRHEERERERERERWGYNNKWVRGMTRNGFHKKKAFSA